MVRKKHGPSLDSSKGSRKTSPGEAVLKGKYTLRGRGDELHPCVINTDLPQSSCSGVMEAEARLQETRLS